MHPSTKKTFVMTAIAAPAIGMLLLSVVFLRGAGPRETHVWLPVEELKHLPADGTPIAASISAKHFDAWMQLPDLNATVFVRKTAGAQGVTVFHPWHHEGFRIPIQYDEAEQQYRSRCWNVTFDLDGNDIGGSPKSLTGGPLKKGPARVIDEVVWVDGSGLVYRMPGAREQHPKKVGRDGCICR